MSGIRKMIYIKNSDIWESIRGAAKSCGRSVSNYLVNLHRERLLSICPECRLELGHRDGCITGHRMKNNGL